MIRELRESDLKNIRKFIKECNPLGFHTLYTYWILFYHFNDYCFLAEEDGKILGLITGFASQRDDSVSFIWQI